MPFILRGVSLIGINSVVLPAALRAEIWRRVATDLKPRHLDRIVTDEIALDALPQHFARYIEGRAVGRTLVRIGA